MPGDLQLRQIPPEMEELLRTFASVAPPEEAARLIANCTNRSAALLHKLARDQAALRKGKSDWSTWAKLVNASRSAVLAASMCREIANNLAKDRNSEGENEPSIGSLAKYLPEGDVIDFNPSDADSIIPRLRQD